ncbi:MAG: peptidoglycan editing factor PgeF [Candidatus Omnitrophica bacterium]|nr:peptidoglycan editing factor PgeF [Candidatus Omnitrophota bacterium]
MLKVNALKNNIYFPFAKLATSNLACAISPRSLGNMSYVYAGTENSLDNRRDFLKNLGVDYRSLVCAKQVHGSSIKYVKEGQQGKGALSDDNSIPDTDALATDARNLPLAIFTADCLPIFLYDPLTPAVALVHAGWKGTRDNITVKTLQLMQARFGSKISGLYIGFGPAIRSCCYEVGEDFKNYFSTGIIRKGNHSYLDLIQLNKRQVLEAGACEDNIFDSRICTSCRSADFFSFRKEGKNCGRMMSIIMLK